jgi:hypothetical protein
MTNARPWLAMVGETMFPHAFLRPEFAEANSGLATGLGSPLLLKTWGASRFPTPLPAHGPTEAGP